MRSSLIILLLIISIMSISVSIAGAGNVSANKSNFTAQECLTPCDTREHENIAANDSNFTAQQIVTESNRNQSHTDTPVGIVEQKFRVGPTVRLRPLNSEIDKSADGLVELFLDNPSLNDVTLETDLQVNVPSDIYIYASEGGMAGGAGAVTGHFSVSPGSARTITLHVVAHKKGMFPIHFSGMYWAGNNKDKWSSISLDNSFEVKEPSATTVSTPTPGGKKMPEIEGAGLVLILIVAFLVRRKKGNL